MIPNKSNFKFQELTPITGVKPYVLRFWEAEFDDISPVVSDSGQKLYARKDVEAILKIKNLLFEKKLSIPEAKEFLKSSEQVMDSAVVPARSVRSQPVVDDHLQAGVKQALEFIKVIKEKRNW